jgi:hypothetical protein
MCSHEQICSIELLIIHPRIDKGPVRARYSIETRLSPRMSNKI